LVCYRKQQRVILDFDNKILDSNQCNKESDYNAIHCYGCLTIILRRRMKEENIRELVYVKKISIYNTFASQSYQEEHLGVFCLYMFM
jgi:hypothetical protein